MLGRWHFCLFLPWQSPAVRGSPEVVLGVGAVELRGQWLPPTALDCPEHIPTKCASSNSRITFRFLYLESLMRVPSMHRHRWGCLGMYFHPESLYEDILWSPFSLIPSETELPFHLINRMGGFFLILIGLAATQ